MNKRIETLKENKYREIENQKIYIKLEKLEKEIEKTMYERQIKRQSIELNESVQDILYIKICKNIETKKESSRFIKLIKLIETDKKIFNKLSTKTVKLSSKITELKSKIQKKIIL